MSCEVITSAIIDSSMCKAKAPKDDECRPKLFVDVVRGNLSTFSSFISLYFKLVNFNLIFY